MPMWYSCAPRPDKEHLCVGLINVTTEQHSFLDLVAQCAGDLNKAFALQPTSTAQKQVWIRDTLFWNAVRALQAQISRARHLNEDFVKDKMIAVANGDLQINKIQMAAINSSARILGMGLARNNQGKVSIRPDEIEVSFGDGPPCIAPKPTIPSLPGKNPATDAPDPSIKPPQPVEEAEFED